MPHPILLAIDPVHRPDLLTPELEARLAALGAPVVRLAPAEVRAAGWPAILATHQPAVLITFWGLPQLPEGLPLATDGDAALRYVCHLGGSVRALVHRSLIERGLIVTNWGETINPTVAEATLLAVLSALRRSTHWARVMHLEKSWRGEVLGTKTLIGRRVGIHGFGGIARELIPMLRPFKVEIAAYSPSVPDAVYEKHGVRRVATLDELFSQSEVLVELAPATPANRHLVDARLLSLLPDDAVFANLGRGMVVDEVALTRQAASGRLRVALDVYEKEPLPADSPLRGLRNVELYPHTGGPTPDFRRVCAAHGIDNLEAFLAGRALQSVVSLEIYDRST
jgi:phosphoglycerate dehydrogenase-like enzyme